VKIALSILCSLMLLWAQLAVAAVPAAGAIAGQPMKHCCCGGKMSCCHASAPQPLAATPQLGSQNQIVSPVPAVVVWVLAAAETSSISPIVASALTAGDAPLFARHCAWLI